MLDVPAQYKPLDLDTIPRMFFRTALAHKDKELFYMERGESVQKLTYGEALVRVKNLAASLIKEGFKSGDKIAVIGENCPNWEIAYLAIQWAGCTVVPLDRMLKTAEIRHILKDSESAGIFASPDFVEISDEALSDIKSRFTRIAMYPAGQKRWLDFTKLVAQGAKLPEVEPWADIWSLAAILYTSGTTGQAKGVMLTHHNIASNISGLYQVFGFGPQDVFISILPLHHSFEATCGFLCPACTGARIAFSPSLKSKDIIDTMGKHGATIVLGVPLLYEKMAEGVMRNVKSASFLKRLIFNTGMGLGRVSKGISKAMFGSVRKALGMENVRCLVAGGAALVPWVGRFMERLGLPIFQGYGMTESSPVIAVSRAESIDILSVGPMLPGFEGVRIDNPDDDGNGEIVVKGPSVMKGYYKNPEATREVLTQDGWLHTGDLGRVDKRGFVFITGRVKNLVVTAAGKNVYPEEVETVVSRNPYVSEILVYGQHNETTNREEIHAVIVPNYELINNERPKLSEAELEEFLRAEISRECENLADYKRIKHFELREDELPKTTTNKVKRYLFAKKTVSV